MSTKKSTQRTNPTEGIYSAYWKVEEDKSGFKSVELVMPDKQNAPNEVKLMIAQGLLVDLNIPVRIEEHLIRNGYAK